MSSTAAARIRGSELTPALRILILAILLVVAAGGLALGLRQHHPDDRRAGATGPVNSRIRDLSKVYYGNPRRFQKPAVITLKKVFPEIAHYRRIKSEGLKRTDARYHLLMERASREFREIVRRVAKARGHDLVIEQHYLKPARDGRREPDLTRAVIRRLRKKA